MTLVERFIEFDRWPASRKTAVLAAFMTAICGFSTAVMEISYTDAGSIINVNLLRWMLWPNLVCLAIAFLVSLAVDRRGLEGHWTAWLVIVPYALFLAGVIYGFGAVSSPFLAVVAMVGLITMMIWGVRIGAAAILFGFVLLLVAFATQFDERFTYAPMLTSRSIDAQRGGWYAGIAAFVVLVTFAACLAVLVLLMAARKLQESRLEQTTRMIRRYVPSQLAEKIISGQGADDAKPERVKLTIFFSDLVGFTDVAEDLDPEDLSRVLNEYFSEMTAIADKHGGTVDELTGDAILIFFGAPTATNDKDHALRAARMALEMQQAIGALNAKWRAAGIAEPLHARMGIDTGVVTIGNFGSPDRMKYAALGKHVNVASRLQSHCAPGRVLVSHATWLLISSEMPSVEKGELHLKGIHKPVMAYELLAS